MRKKFRLLSIFMVMMMLLSAVLSKPSPTTASTVPSADFTVAPESTQLILNADRIAEGKLNIKVTPTGKITQKDREPIDVAFVYDTSGSMEDAFSEEEYQKGYKKSRRAKEALTSALTYFEDNQQSGDKFYFIPFNDDVRNDNGNNAIKVVQGLNEIKKISNYVDQNKKNFGGTNYSQTLDYTENLLKNSRNKNKYIILLTDGEPTVLKDNGWEYILYTNGTAVAKKGWTYYRNYQETKKLIHEKALKSSEKLSTSGITMYSVGFAKENEIDFKLLQNMSSKTGGYAVQANGDNLTAVFEQISERIDSHAISGEVTVDLSKYGGKVSVPTTANVLVDEAQIAHIPFHFNFPVGMEPNPRELAVQLPLIFSEAGSYQFDNIKLNYADLVKPHASLTINVAQDANSSPGADYTVKPSAEEFIKPPNEAAKGNIDFAITPKGMAPTDKRLPIEVVFVHDTSGSMAFELDRVRRDITAKSALKTALNYFSTHSNLEDQFHFVPFDSKVSDKNLSINCGFLCRKNIKIEPTTGLTRITEIVDYLDKASEGGTNYNAALSNAMSKLAGPTNKNKYIIFLTDGDPTHLYSDKDYEILSSTDGRGNRTKYGYINGKEQKSYKSVEDVIRTNALDTATLIGNSNITMSSIGFAAEGDIDFQLLQQMSARTGGIAKTGTTSNLATIFEEISSKVDSTSINGTITVDLSEFGSEVKVDPASIYQADKHNQIHIPFSFSFPVGAEPNPNQIPVTLPLQFTKDVSGLPDKSYTYDFTDKVTMTYRDIDGNLQTISDKPLFVHISADTGPQFLSEVKVTAKAPYTPDTLVKERNRDSESNEFSINYKFTPQTVVESITEGKIQHVKIIQPLPEGMTLANSNQVAVIVDGSTMQNGATAKLINGGKDVEVTLNNQEFTYDGADFSIEEFMVDLKIKVNWAIPYTQMPQATMTYTDTAYGNQTLGLDVDLQPVSMNVRLPGSNSIYYGDHRGSISKVDTKTGELVADSLLANENGNIEKPVMGMELINRGTAIEVTYYDGVKAILYLKTDYALKNLSLGKELQSGEETIGRVGFKINDLVLGDDVIYQYQYISNGHASSWAEFDPSATIELPTELEGLVEIRVRTIGGFSLDSNPIIKTVIIQKEKITVDPNPIELEVEEIIDINITFSPVDKDDDQFSVSVANTELAIFENGQLEGLAPGETTLIITTTDINGEELRAEFPIKVKPVLVTAIKVTPNPLNMNKHDEFDDFTIVIEPKNATVKIKDLIWESLSPTTVSIVRPGVLYGRNTGTAEIVIRANDGSKVETTIVVNVGIPLKDINAPDEIIIEKGATDKNVNHYITFVPEKPTNIKGTAVFESLNESILEVDPNGDIIPKRVGNTVITILVMDEDGNTYEADIRVKVVEKNYNENNKDDKY